MPDLTLDLFDRSAIQKRIVAVLMDGKSHPRNEVLVCLGDELASPSNLGPHLTSIRRVIQPLGLDVVCVNGGYMRSVRYRLIRQYLIE